MKHKDENEGVGKRRRSKVEAYYHLIWTTKGRQARVTPEFERPVYRCIGGEVERFGGFVLALNGMTDHVHLVVRAPGPLGPSEIARRVKGVSSALMNDLRPEFSDLFHWQPGYACFTLWRNVIPRVVTYVNNQKHHHAAGTLWPEWEEADETDPTTNTDDENIP